MMMIFRFIQKQILFWLWCKRWTILSWIDHHLNITLTMDHAKLSWSLFFDLSFSFSLLLTFLVYSYMWSVQTTRPHVGKILCVKLNLIAKREFTSQNVKNQCHYYTHLEHFIELFRKTLTSWTMNNTFTSPTSSITIWLPIGIFIEVRR